MKSKSLIVVFSSILLGAAFADAPRLHGPKVYGARSGSEIIYRIPTTGTRPVAWSSVGLPDGRSVRGEFDFRTADVRLTYLPAAKIKSGKRKNIN